MILDPLLPVVQGSAGAGTQSARLRDAAVRLETLFLAEMLKAAGLGQPRSSFGGGAGEEQFASFLAEAQAGELARAGGIGLAETLFRAMSEPQHDR